MPRKDRGIQKGIKKKKRVTGAVLKSNIEQSEHRQQEKCIAIMDIKKGGNIYGADELDSEDKELFLDFSETLWRRLAINSAIALQ
jgi:hypothetical protein